MARPKKEQRIKRNGEYVQVFEDGFIASFSCAEMVKLARVKRRIGTKRLLAQLEVIKIRGDSGGSGTEHG